MRRYLRVVTDGAVIGLAAAAVLSGFGVGAAQAEVGNDCRTVTVENRVGPDSGENGNNWATTTVDRKLTVCVVDATGEVWTYDATVVDSGEFVTLAGDSPGAGTEVKLVGGATGTVNGGFKARFTAPAWTGGTKLVAPDPETTSGNWVATAFPGAEVFTAKGAVDEWRWVYNRCGADGFWWVNAHDGNSGDITEKACPTPEPTKPTATPTPSASATATASPTRSATGAPVPSQSTSQAGLPVTGAPAKFGFALGAILVLVGGTAIVVSRRRRNTFEA